MRRHTDLEGAVRSVTVTTSEWRKLSRQRRSRDRRRCYLWVRCDVEGRKQVPRANRPGRLARGAPGGAALTPLRVGRVRDYAPQPMTSEPLDLATAERLWAELNDPRVGGLVNVSGLAEQWSTTASRVKELMRNKSLPFPAPVVDQERGKLWLAAAVDTWLREYNARPGKPGPKPTGPRGDS